MFVPGVVDEELESEEEGSSVQKHRSIPKQDHISGLEFRVNSSFPKSKADDAGDSGIFQLQKEPTEACSLPFSMLPSEEKDLEAHRSKQLQLEAGRDKLLARFAETKQALEEIVRENEGLEACNTRLESELKGLAGRLKSQIAIKVKLEVEREVKQELRDQYKTHSGEPHLITPSKDLSRPVLATPQLVDRTLSAAPQLALRHATRTAPPQPTEGLLLVQSLRAAGEKARDFPNHLKSSRLLTHTMNEQVLHVCSQFEDSAKKSHLTRKGTDRTPNDLKALFDQAVGNSQGEQLPHGNCSLPDPRTPPKSPLSVQLVEERQASLDKQVCLPDRAIAPDQRGWYPAERSLMQQPHAADGNLDAPAPGSFNIKKEKSGYLSDYLLKIEKCAAGSQARCVRSREKLHTATKSRTANKALNQTEELPTSKNKRHFFKQPDRRLERTFTAGRMPNRSTAGEGSHTLTVLRRVESLLSERSFRNYRSADKPATSRRAQETQKPAFGSDSREPRTKASTLPEEPPSASSNLIKSKLRSSRSMRLLLPQHSEGATRK